MSTAVKLVLDRAATILNDLGNDRWTQAELLDWLDAAQVALITLRPDAKTETREMALVAGAAQTLPADCIALMDVAYNKDGSAITPCDKAALDAFSPGWAIRPTDSSVRHWMASDDPKVFYVYPAQNATPATVSIVASVYPLKATASGFIDVRDIYAERLVNYILYRAFSKDAEFSGSAEKAVAFYQAFSA